MQLGETVHKFIPVCRGGVYLTVEGTNLDSVAYPLMRVKVKYSLNNSTNWTDFTVRDTLLSLIHRKSSICRVDTLNTPCTHTHTHTQRTLLLSRDMHPSPDCTAVSRRKGTCSLLTDHLWL